MAVAPYRAGQLLGWLPDAASGTWTQQNTAAANWLAVSFIPDSGRTLSAARVFVSAVAGTLASGDITASLYDSAGSNGAPGSSIETGKLPSATITASGWYDFTGFTTALTSGQQYWIVFKNGNGTPASNNCTFRGVSGATEIPLGGSIFRFAWARATSTNSGSAWSNTAGNVGMRISYADGSYDGYPISNTAAAAVGDGVYATRESGVKFTSPPNGVLKIAGISMLLGSPTGTPTNGLRFGLWTGGTPANLAYTNTVPVTASASGGQWIYAYFASTQTLQPGTIVRVTLATSGADASTKRYVLQEVTWDTDSNSVILLPWEGTATKTYYDGSSWTDSALGTSMFAHAVLLDTAGEFGAGAGTSGGFVFGG